MTGNGEKEVFQITKEPSPLSSRCPISTPSKLERHNKGGDLMIQIYIRTAVASLYIKNRKTIALIEALSSINKAIKATPTSL